MITRTLEKKDIPDVEHIYDLYWTGGFRENLSRRLKQYIENASDISEQGFAYFVAEENGEVVGVAAFRKVQEHMLRYTTTNNSAEIYIFAVKNRSIGIGGKMLTDILNEIRFSGYSEVILFSGETHQESWGFYDHSDFIQVADAMAPDGEKGKVWRMGFI